MVLGLLVLGACDGWGAELRERWHVPAPGHAGEVSAIAWCDGGRRVVTSAADGTVRFWEADTGREQVRSRLRTVQSVHVLRVSPDCRHVLAADSGVRGLLEWDDGHRTSHMLDEHERVIWISTDGRRVASTRNSELGEPGFVALRTRSAWSREFGPPREVLRCVGWVRSERFSTTINCRDDSYVWNPREGRPSALSGGESAAVVADDGSLLVTVFPPASYPGRYLRLALRRLDGSARDRELRIHLGSSWDTRQRRYHLSLRGDLLAVAESNEVWLFAVPRGELLAHRQAAASPIATMAFSTAGDQLATGHDDGSWSVFDVPARTGSRERPELAQPETVAPRGRGDALRRVLGASRSGVFVTIGVTGRVERFDADVGRRVVERSLPRSWWRQPVALSPRGRLLAYAASDEEEHVVANRGWQRAEVARLGQQRVVRCDIPAEDGYVWGPIAFDASERWIAAAGGHAQVTDDGDERIRTRAVWVWDLRTPQRRPRRVEMPSRAGEIVALDLGEDGRRLVAVTAESERRRTPGRLLTWDLRARGRPAPAPSLEGLVPGTHSVRMTHAGPTVAFGGDFDDAVPVSPDGRWLAHNQTRRDLWEVAPFDPSSYDPLPLNRARRSNSEPTVAFARGRGGSLVVAAATDDGLVAYTLVVGRPLTPPRWLLVALGGFGALAGAALSWARARRRWRRLREIGP